MATDETKLTGSVVRGSRLTIAKFYLRDEDRGGT